VHIVARLESRGHEIRRLRVYDVLRAYAARL